MILNCRRSLDEKLYTRDLQLALKKSTANENALKSSNSDTSKSHNEPLAVNGCEFTRPNDGNCHGATARLHPPSIVEQSGTSAHQLSTLRHIGYFIIILAGHPASLGWEEGEGGREGGRGGRGREGGERRGGRGGRERRGEGEEGGEGREGGTGGRGGRGGMGEREG